jgi:hypothetical protein
MRLVPNNLTPKKNNRWLIPALIIVLFIAGTIGFFVYRHHVIKKKQTFEATLPAIRISLKNGCGFEGAATEMTEFLADKNIDIVATGNAEKFIYNKSIIVVKKMDRDDLLRLMKMTGITQWTLAESEYPLAPFVIVIGKDYEDLISNQKKE